MKIDAKQALLEHASEELDAAFVPGAPTPRPPPQTWQHAELAERHRRGDFGPDTERVKPGLAGFLAAMAQSFDYGAPVRSSAAGWEAHANGNGAIGTAGFARPPDSLTAREEYSLAHREILRIAESLPIAHVHSGHAFDGPAQMRMWTEVHGPGALVHTVIRGGPERRVKGMGVIAASPVVTVPERRKKDATDYAELVLKPMGVIATPHEVGLICRSVTRRVEAAFIARGWVRAKRVKAALAAEGESLDADTIEGWKLITDIVERSENTCRKLAVRPDDPLPVRDYLGKPRASHKALTAWKERQLVARSA